MAIDERRRIAHLLRRAGFGATPAELAEYLDLGFDASVERLLHPESIEENDLELPADVEGDQTRAPAIQLRWLARMARSRRPLAEKMAFIWHGHFATSVEKVKSVTLMWDQYETLRDHGLGRFEDLTLAVAQDPAMLVWLDNARSRKESPNENFARELMELFTLGVGNYTEDDVKAAARAFTGWSIVAKEGTQIGDEDLPRDPELEDATDVESAKERKKNGTATDADRAAIKEARRTRDAEFAFRRNWHDEGEKTFLGQTGAWDGEDIIRLITTSDACARFITRKLFAAFLWDDPSEDDLAPFVEVFAGSSGDIRETVEAMLRSEAFSSEQAYRARVRSPIEVLVATVKALDLDSVRLVTTSRTIKSMGQILFAPPNVGGWPHGLGWIGPSALLQRYNLVGELLAPGKKRQPGGFDVAAFIGDADITTEEGLVDHVVDRMLDGDIDPAQRDALIAYLQLDDAGASGTFSFEGDRFAGKVRGLIRLAATIPTYQLS